VVLRWHTKTVQKLPNKNHRILKSFYKVVTKLKEEKSYELGNNFNMDETSVCEKIVHIHTIDNNKNRFM
ncbi:6340_t:CDS:2, partial [Gigaspora margarita]